MFSFFLRARYFYLQLFLILLKYILINLKNSFTLTNTFDIFFENIIYKVTFF